MGSDAYGPLFNSPKVALGLTAQTRRSEDHVVGRTRVYSICSTLEFPYSVFEDRDEAEKTSFKFVRRSKSEL